MLGRSCSYERPFAGRFFALVAMARVTSSLESSPRFTPCAVACRTKIGGHSVHRAIEDRPEWRGWARSRF